MKRFTAILLTAGLLMGMILPTAAAGDGKLHFVLSEDYGEILNSEFTIDLYKGGVKTVNTKYTTDVKNGDMVEVKKNCGTTTDLPAEAGLYTYYVHGDDVYSVFKAFVITEADLAAGTKTLTLEGGKRAGTGFEPGAYPAGTSLEKKKSNRDLFVHFATDEVLKNYEIAPQGYTTPAFTKQHAAHQFTTQEEMIEFVNETTAKSDKLHRFNLGTTSALKYDIPLVVITDSAVPASATLDEAAEIVKGNGKPTVWVGAQVHANEPSSGEAALVLLEKFAADAEVQKKLEKINVVIVPRISVESSYYFMRDTAQYGDPNRDYVKLESEEISYVTAGWMKFMPEVSLDLHELLGYVMLQPSQKMYTLTDSSTKCTTNLNQSPALYKLGLDMVGNTLTKMTEQGYWMEQYSASPNPTTANNLYGLYNGLSFLIEVRGIGIGRSYLERRVSTHEKEVFAYMDYVAEHAEEIRTAVAAARADTIAAGKTMQDKDDFALYQKASGRNASVAPYTVTIMSCKATDGVPYVKKADVTYPTIDMAVRSRPRPTGYVLAADMPDIEKVLKMCDGHGIEYWKLDAGTALELQQYFYVQDYFVQDDAGNKEQLGIEADLRDAQTVTFANGAYFFPMDQVGATILAYIMEPDINDYETYKGSLVNLEIVGKDGNQNYPIYRYTGEDPRAAFGPKEAVAETPASETPAAETTAAAPAAKNIALPAVIAGAAVLAAAAIAIVAVRRKKKN